MVLFKDIVYFNLYIYFLFYFLLFRFSLTLLAISMQFYFWLSAENFFINQLSNTLKTTNFTSMSFKNNFTENISAKNFSNNTTPSNHPELVFYFDFNFKNQIEVY
jgi:hypothetical protein